VRTYILPVRDGGDGPYAKQSQWQFWVVPDAPGSTYTGAYTFTAVAKKTI
jgi:hypothetical protein